MSVKKPKCKTPLSAKIQKKRQQIVENVISILANEVIEKFSFENVASAIGMTRQNLLYCKFIHSFRHFRTQRLSLARERVLVQTRFVYPINDEDDRRPTSTRKGRDAMILTAYRKILLIFVLSSCVTPADSPTDLQVKESIIPVQSLSATVDKDFVRLQSLVEEALTLRSKSIDFGKRVLERKPQVPLSSAELDELNRGLLMHVDVHDRMMRIVRRYGALLDDKQYGSADRIARLKGVMIGLSAALVLYDNYLLSVRPFEANDAIRTTLNLPDSGYAKDRDRLFKATAEFNSIENEILFAKAVAFIFERPANQTFLDASGKDLDLSYLLQLIESSPSFAEFRKRTPLKRWADSTGMFFRRGFDVVRGAGRETMHVASRWFGNNAGLVETRRGKLEKPEFVQRVRTTLRPLDVLLERTPFRLTDKLIPGHFGHVAIWIGTEAELKSMGLWLHPLVVPHHASIRQGKSVLEALRSGVQLSRLEEFMNIDDIAVLRKKQLGNDERRDSVLRAFRQIGKEYDFNFDVETTDRIVCSELAYVTFTQVPWLTAGSLGRETISPDQVAKMSIGKASVFELILFYHDGGLISQGASKLIEQLLATSS